MRPRGLLPLLLVACVFARPAAAGLIAHFKFDETSGNTAVDSSGNGNHGSLVGGILWTADGAIDGAIQFPVSNGIDRVTAGNFDLTGTGVTLAAWIRQEGDLNDTLLIMKSSGSNSANQSWGLTADDDGNVNFLIKAGGVWFQLQLSNAIATNKWYHVAGTYDGATLRIYINGKLSTSAAHPVGGAVATQSGQTVSLGEATDGDKEFEGKLDDARIYDSAISAVEIAKLFGLIGHWKFNEGSGATAADSTALANNATLSGATWITDCLGQSAIDFNGAGDTATTNAVFAPPATGAVAFWMRGSGPLSVRERIFGVNGNWESRVEVNGTISFDLGASPYVGNEPFATTTSVDQQNRWYHIVANFDATDDSYEVYVDGQLEASGTSPVNLVQQNAATLSFGTRTGSSEYWEGALRDFRVYNRFLLDEEIVEFSGLIARWRLDETSGTVAADSGVSRNDATYVGGPTLGVAGAFTATTATAVELDGATQSITAGTSLLDNLSQFTIAGWIRPGSITPNRSFFGQYDLIELGINSVNNQIDLWTNAGGSISVAQFLPPGKWSHLLATGDGTQLKLYVNGVEVASGGSATSDYGNNGNATKIGEGVLNSTGDYFDGRVDDVRIYSRALCPDEARSLYKGGRPAGVRIIRWNEIR